MSMPTQAQLDTRTREAKEKLQKFREAHDAFLTSWNEIMKDAETLKQDLSGHVDTAKLHEVLKHIDAITDESL